MAKNLIKYNFTDNKNAWSNNAERLAKFVVANLINRDDAYGKYRSLDDRNRGTALTVKSGISESVVQAHFRAEDRGQLIGLHTTSARNTCKSMVIDIDHHGDPDPDSEKVNELAALDLYGTLLVGGLAPLLFKSNGRGGFHICVIFSPPAPTEHVYKFGNAVVAHWKELGLAESPEVFPKQQSLDGNQLGNWVRLPGLHHTYDFYTEVWDGEKWLAGQAAVDRICDHQPVSAEWLESFEIEKVDEEPIPNTASQSVSGDERPIDRVLAELADVQRSGAGYISLCPNHPDVDPSLSINESKEGHVLLHCFAGCENEQIVEAIGLNMRDLFARSPDGTDRQLRHLYPPVQTDNSGPLDQTALHRSALDKTEPDKIEELATSLGVSSSSLQELQVAWSEPDGCWLFPERDHQKRIIGLLKRLPDGTKKFVSGGSRGLYIPASFNASKPKIIVVEGGSDTAAGLSLGWNVIGRPSAFEGVSLLISLLKSATGQILVLGDNDPRRDGSWPGRRGAEEAAHRLESALRIDVFVANPPMEFKDLREWARSGEQVQ